MEFSRKILSFLKDWLEKKGRKPLVIRGARQVGKTSAVLLFGKKHFKNFIHINLEKIEHRRLFAKEVSLTEFEKIINIIFGKSLTASKTLLFLDEIQEVPHLIKLLRFFWEERPDLPVVAAGSLFEARIKEEALSLPVGRLEFAYLYPLDFFEYLEAGGEERLLKYLKNFDFKEKIPAAFEDKLLSLFFEYALIGGMPEAVKIYTATKDLNQVNSLYSNLFTSFKDDTYKYSSSTKTKYLTFILEQAPLFAGLPITYEKFAGSIYKSREMAEAFDLLEKALILQQIRATKSIQLPLLPQKKKPAKLIFLDLGLVNYQMGIQSSYLRMADLADFYRGRIAEQICGQQLLSSFIASQAHLFYWYKQAGSQAEVDFCLAHKGRILGFEVKSGSAGRLKSAGEFLKKVDQGIIIRVYSGPFEKKGRLISLPFYLLPRWPDLV